MKEETKNYVMTKNELDMVCKNIARRWTVARREDVEKELSYDVIDKQGYEEFWNGYEKSTEDDVRDWIDCPDDCGGHNVFFNADDVPETEEWEDEVECGDADDLEEDTLDRMWSDTNHYDDCLDMEEELKPYIRKIKTLSDVEVENATWTMTESDGCKTFETTICGHKYTVTYDGDDYTLYLDGEDVTWELEDTSATSHRTIFLEKKEWECDELAKLIADKLGVTLETEEDVAED